MYSLSSLFFWLCRTSKEVNAPPQPSRRLARPGISVRFSPKVRALPPQTSQVLKAIKKKVKVNLLFFWAFRFPCQSYTCLPPPFSSASPHASSAPTPHTSSFSCPGRNVWGSMFLLWSGRAELGSARLETALSRPPALSGYPGRRQLSEAIWHILTYSPTGCSSSLNSAARRPQFDFNSPMSFSLAVTLISPVSNLLTDNLLAAGIFGEKPKICCRSPACYPSLLSGCCSLRESSTVVGRPQQLDNLWFPLLNTEMPPTTCEYGWFIHISSNCDKNSHKKHRPRKTNHLISSRCTYPPQLHQSLISHTVHLWEKVLCSSCPGRNHPNRWQLLFQPVLWKRSNPNVMLLLNVFSRAD